MLMFGGEIRNGDLRKDKEWNIWWYPVATTWHLPFLSQRVFQPHKPFKKRLSAVQLSLRSSLFFCEKMTEIFLLNKL